MPNHFFILILAQYSHLLSLRKSNVRGCNPIHKEDFQIVVKQGIV